jgi:acyl transferase domain-containing protein/acyl-CoA synthetase (AMP-forming)/AMP-acid ligase II/NAD(P)-dependent dehydrogenase (short-subunit alcohol dehydrogenase family)/acyl carrier protein
MNRPGHRRGRYRHHDAAFTPQNFCSLVQIVRHWAAVSPDQVALVFLADGEAEAERLTYRELDRRARVFAKYLQAENLSGQCVLLMLPSGVPYVVAFLGCLYAQAIPVPAYPPTSSMHAERVARIVEDCNAKGVVLANSHAMDSILSKFTQLAPERLPCAYLVMEGLPDKDSALWVEPALARTTLAYLQYTSGSTGTPRGVMVAHGNLVEHARHLQAGWQQDHTDIFVTWLPLFHDLGLIGGVIQPLYLGATTIIIPPAVFMQKPRCWLSAISRYHATTTHAPNFAYELCASALQDEQLKSLDLSSWHVALNGAEPVRADTLAKFADKFAPFGFRAATMNPAYGLAEATLTVSYHRKLSHYKVREVDAEALERNRFVPATSAVGKTRSLVSCGKTWLDISVAIVDPQSGQVCNAGEVGEIWVHGPTVPSGYWKRPEETARTFQAYLPDGAGPFLRTGDLGVLHEGELYVTGRLKDLMIFRGQNHYPQDIEHTVVQAHASLESGHGAAFSVDVDGEERLVVVQEVRRTERRKINGNEVVQAIRAAIADKHGLRVYAVLLLKPASVPITSSGKIQRQGCRRSYREKLLEPLYAWQEGASAATGVVRHETVVAWLVEKMSQKKHIPEEQVYRDAPFSSFGLDSLEIVALTGELAQWLKVPVEPMALYDYPTINLLAHFLSGADVNTEHSTQRKAAEPIAIVGMACRFPGANSVEEFWQLLESGTDAITDIPASRWAADEYFEAGVNPRLGKMNSRWGGFVDAVDEFDANFFGISSREMQSMDPQQRLLLQETWHALEDAGIPPDSLAGSNSGVFVGITHVDYRLLLSEQKTIDAYYGTGNVLCIAANRISYLLDVHGPSYIVDTACSSSFAALHQARISLLSKECGVAIVGGVNLLLSPDMTLATSQAHMLSPDGRCKTFDASADGYVRSEGCAVFILKRHSDAVRDNDRILALISGSAVNQDGKSNGLTAPNGQAQQAVMTQALESAGVLPEHISYVEAHGTGTSLGDPIEIGAIKQVYGAQGKAAAPLWIGSVKTNVGHLEAAAGMAGLMKVVLAMQHEKIPRHLHLQQLNPLISFDGTRCAIPASPQTWPREGQPRFAAVSSFGFGGTNTHVIVCEAPAPATLQRHIEDPSKWHMLTLTAKSDGSLRRLAKRYVDFLQLAADSSTGNTFAEICRAAQVHRTHYIHRIGVLSHSRQDAAAQLQSYLLGDEPRDVMSGAAAYPPHRKLAFLFTGQGSQYANMGRHLFHTHANFRQTLQRCDAILQPLIGKSLLAILHGTDETEADLTQTCYAQPALFALEYALASVWQSCGVQPAYLIGHSLGEFVAACIAGVFSLESGLKLVAHRGRLMQTQTDPGVMVAVRAAEPLLAQLLEEFRHCNRNRMAVAAYNSPQDIVLAGDETALKPLIDKCAALGAKITPLQVTRAFHSPLMAGMLVEFERIANDIAYHPPRIPVVSNITGQCVGAEIACADYWVRHVMAPVQFAAGVKTLAAHGCGTFIEIGPHPVLTALGQQAIADGLWLPSLRRDMDADCQFQRSLMRWYTQGGNVNWRQWVRDRVGSDKLAQPIALPNYPFQPDRYWFTSARPQTGGTETEESAFWQAVEHGDLDLISGTLGIEGEDQDDALAALLPVLSAWRQKSQKQNAVNSLRYRIAWKRLAIPQMEKRNGTWLLVTSDQPCESVLEAALTQALADAGGKVVTVRLAAADSDRTLLAARLPEALGEGVVPCGVLSLLALDERPQPAHPELPGGLALSLLLIQALGDLAIEAPVWLLTRGAVSIDPTDQLRNPLQALTWGLGYAVSGEQPERWGGMIDISDTFDAKTAERIVAVLGARNHEDQLALRPSGLFVRRLVRAPLNTTMGSAVWKPRGTVLVTGGTGALGMHVARWLAKLGASHIVLTSRRGAEAPGAAELQSEMGVLGTRITLAACDVSDLDATAALLRRLEAEGSVIQSVFHAAGVLEHTPIAATTLFGLADVVAGKAAGARHLSDLLGDRPLDAFVLFSSIAGIWGSGQQGAYSAANAFLNAFAEQRRSQGVAATSIAWGMWAGAGMAGNAMLRERFQRYGLIPLSPELALTALQQSLDHAETSAIVTDIDWARFSPSFAAARRRPLLDEIPEARQALEPLTEPAAAESHANHLVETLRVLDEGDRHRHLLALVLKETAAVLGLRDGAGLSPDTGFLDLGMDSLMAVELRQRLKKATGLNLPATLAFDYPTPTAAAMLLLDNLEKELGVPASVERRQERGEDKIRRAPNDVAIRKPRGQRVADSAEALAARIPDDGSVSSSDLEDLEEDSLLALANALLEEDEDHGRN